VAKHFLEGIGEKRPKNEDSMDASGILTSRLIFSGITLVKTKKTLVAEGLH
jgi:hypothetical protein